PPAGDEVQHVEGVGAGRLVGLVVGHQPAEEVGRQHLGRPEVLAGERGLAAAGRADQHDQAELGQRDGAHAGTRGWGGSPAEAGRARASRARWTGLRRTPRRTARSIRSAESASAARPRATSTAAASVAERPWPAAQWTYTVPGQAATRRTAAQNAASDG